MFKRARSKCLLGLILWTCISSPIAGAAGYGPAYFDDYEFNILLQKMNPTDLMYFEDVGSYKLLYFDLTFMHNSNQLRVGDYHLNFIGNKAYDDGTVGSFYLNPTLSRVKRAKIGIC